MNIHMCPVNGNKAIEALTAATDYDIDNWSTGLLGILYRANVGTTDLDNYAAIGERLVQNGHHYPHNVLHSVGKFLDSNESYPPFEDSGAKDMVLERMSAIYQTCYVRYDAHLRDCRLLVSHESSTLTLRTTFNAIAL